MRRRLRALHPLHASTVEDEAPCRLPQAESGIAADGSAWRGNEVEVNIRLFTIGDLGEQNPNGQTELGRAENKTLYASI